MVDKRFELTTNDPWSVDDAICEGFITGVHSNQDQIWFQKFVEYIGFYVDRRS